MRRIIVILVLVACTPTVARFETNTAPTSIAYPVNPLDLARGAPMATDTPGVRGGTATQFSVSPTLPAGLSLDAQTGTLSGTPTATQASATYHVTASNAFGTVGVDVTIAISDAPPAGLTYAPNPDQITRGLPMTPVTPTWTGGLPTNFITQQTLPDGLVLDAITGTISGTPKSNAPMATITIAASNIFGTSTAAWSVRIADQTPVVVFPNAPYTAVLGINFSSGAPTVSGGAITDCAWLDPSIETITNLHVQGAVQGSTQGATCAVSGIAKNLLPASVAGAPIPLVVSFDGGTASATIDLTVNAKLAIVPPAITVPAASGMQLTFTATGGAPPYAYSILGSGAISLDGTFTAGSRNAPTIVGVTDATGVSAIANVTYVSTFANGPVQTSTIVGTNDLYVGGAFTRLYPLPVSDVAAFYVGNGDVPRGETDLRFDSGTGFSPDVSSVYATAASTDALYFGGNFDAYNGNPTTALVKVSRSGTFDPEFNDLAMFNPGDSVNALAVDDTGLYAGGQLSFYRGAAVNSGIVKLDPTTGDVVSEFFPPSLNPAPPIPPVNAIALNAGSLYIAGSFTGTGFYNSSILKLDAQTGELQSWGSVTQGPQVSGTAYISALASDDAYLYVAGNFTACRQPGAPATFPCGHLARISLTDATFDTAYNSALGAGFNDNVFSLYAAGDGLFVGGLFGELNGSLASNLVKLTTSGSLAKSYSPFSALPDQVSITALAYDGTNIYAGGIVTEYATTPVDNIVAINASTGDIDPTFATYAGATISPLGPSVFAEVLSGDQLIAAGQFQSAGGISRRGVAKLTLDTRAVDPVFDPGTGFTEALQSGIVAALVAAPSSLGPGLYVGGAFNAYQGHAVNDFARIDLSTAAFDNTCVSGGGFNGGVAGVTAMALADSELEVIVGGDFTSYTKGATTPSNSIISLGTNGCGVQWSSAAFSSGVAINAIAASDVTVYAGGTQPGGLTAFDFSGNASSKYNSTANAFNAAVTGIAIDPASPYADVLYVSTVASTKFDSSVGPGQLFAIQNKQSFSTGIFTQHIFDVNSAPVTNVASNGTAVFGPVVFSPGFLFFGGQLNETNIGGVNFDAFLMSFAPGSTLTGTVSTAFNITAQVYNYQYYIQTISLGGGALFIGGSFNAFGASSEGNGMFIDPTLGIPLP